MRHCSSRLNLAFALLCCLGAKARAEDGYELWLRYHPLWANGITRQSWVIDRANPGRADPRIDAATNEITRALRGLYGPPVSRRSLGGRIVVLGISADLKRYGVGLNVRSLGSEGYLVRTLRVGGRPVVVVTGNSGAGVLYGAFALIREMQLGHGFDRLNLRSAPRYALRMLDHWDNLDRTVERGYAGKSLWDWERLPDARNPRYVDYARANASIGINGVVLNNVNADPRILSAPDLQKVAALAALFRPYAIRVYLSVRFSSPIELGGLKTADPADPSVDAWWRAKADEIYRLIPDFGGFVVKANSEGQPGPQDYHRTHAQGANVIADALKPHGGTVFWRAFVYGASLQDRALQGYEEFRPLDGKFRDNVILQIKNGPIDFQPREPFHPLFGQMPHTQLALEAQITREYLGQNTGVVFLAPMWTEDLRADTCAPRCGRPVRATISAIAGVSNVGEDRNWTGTIFDQANWYAFGRLAWNPRLSAQQIADEWTRQTWSNRRAVVQPITSMMLRSREAVVDFMTPLGLAHQMATDHHYGPSPWVCDLKVRSWNPCYYSRADTQGIGFERVPANGKHIFPARAATPVGGYAAPVASRFAALSTVPDKYLLWFHHVAWTYRMRSGRTLWNELVRHYDQGVREVAWMDRTWSVLRRHVDAERGNEVASDLRREQVEAQWWRDASIAYFQSLSKIALPKGSPKPAHPLAYYEALQPPHLPGQRP